MTFLLFEVWRRWTNYPSASSGETDKLVPVACSIILNISNLKGGRVGLAVEGVGIVVPKVFGSIPTPDDADYLLTGIYRNWHRAKGRQ